MEYESILKATGGFGRLQLTMLATTGLLCFKAIAELQLLVLSMTQPAFRCAQQNSSGYEEQQFGEHCRIRATGNGTSNATLEACDGYEYGVGQMRWTLVQQYDLVCGREWYAALMNSMYFLGIGAGVALGTLGDRIGRKRIFYAAGLLDIVTTALPVLMPDIASQIAARFLKGEQAELELRHLA